MVQGVGEALLFVGHHLLDEGAGLMQFRVNVPHELHHLFGDRREKRGLEVQQAPEAQGPAHDASKHIAPPLVTGQDAIGHEKRGGPGMVGQDPEGHIFDIVVLAVSEARQFLHPADNGAQEIRVEIAVHPLENSREPLQAHARVDAGLREGMHDPVCGAVELHEDQVPDFQIAVAFADADGAVRTAGHVVALVEDDFRAGTAGAGVPHGPEIVFLPQAHDAFRGETGDFLPKLAGFIVVVEHRGPEALLGEAVFDGEELPGRLDGPHLEVIPKGEIPQHLEKGVVPGGVAHVFQVVVLAPGPDALLGTGGPGVGALVLAQETALELHHAGVGEEQGGVAVGHERRAGDDRMALGCVVAQKGVAHVAADHDWEASCSVAGSATGGVAPAP